ncbi:MAG: sigma 54-interacting transcriptional regulator, partial [Myxococcales bacterium]|nr:sigma 54-interacting transcriptional regulator [Myxococcales bacterium]
MDAEARDHEAPLSDVEGGSGRIERLRRERDFYRQLLQLARATDIKALLDEALAQIVALSGASQGYLEIGHRDDGDRPSPWWLANGFDDEELVTVRRAISSGIIAQAIATGRAVRTASAIADPRFSSRGSVKRNAIGSVLCAPVAAPSEAPSGVVYLQGREPFSEEAERDLAFFVEHFAPLVERLLRQGRASDADPTREHRAKLVDHDELVGRTPAMAEILKTVTLVAPLDLHLLITGPTGTGKNALARLVATNSARRGGPFVEVNCAALPDELFESELFGAVPGAHSTAHRALPGKVDAAEGGTLFLD